ncbi:MAG: SPASM domain-containing protein, partial [bacterium]|nr:SPASM domain-containing protein [bacterium]
GYLALLGLRVPLFITVTGANVNRLADIARYFVELNRGADLYFIPVSPVNERGELIPEELLPEPELYAEKLVEVYHLHLIPAHLFHTVAELMDRLRFGVSGWCCGAAFGDTLAMDETGDIYLAPSLIGIDKYRLGNINQKDVEPDKAVLDQAVQEFCVENIPVCKDCSWKYLCGGVCPTVTIPLHTYGDIPDRIKQYVFDIHCISRKRLLETILWDLAETKQKEVEIEQANAGHRRKAYLQNGKLQIPQV